MTITIAGGTGFIGSYIKKRFEENGHKVRVISRTNGDLSWKNEELVKALNTSDVLINLAGKEINCRFTDKNKELILNSRIDTTKMLNEAVSECKKPPKIWINSSAVGIYKHTDEFVLDEYSVDFADDFLGTVVKAWEEEFFRTDLQNTRKIALRTAVVFGKSGGIFPLLNRLSKFGLGGKQGDGNQMFSWIYIEDYFRILQFIIENETMEGVVNAAAPKPVSNKELMRTFKQKNNAVLAIPSPEFILKIASYIIDIQPDLVLNHTNVFSQKLEDFNFEFEAETFDKALDLLYDKTTK